MTRIYLAGAESGPLSDELEENDVKHILYSYFWISKKDHERTMVERIKRGREIGIRYLLDSGAFTYQDAATASEQMPFHVYRARYAKFVQTYGELFEACAELDVECADIPGVGYVDVEQVAGWREEMIEKAPRASIMPVWHFGTRTREEWDSYCDHPHISYIGVGSTHAGAEFNQVGVFSALIARAHKNGKRVHGMAATKIKTQLLQLKYDSVDSASWLSAQKFGTTFIFKGGQWIVLDKTQKHRRRAFRMHFKKVGVDYEALEADKAKELRHAAIIAWRDLGEHLMRKRAAMHKDLAGQVAVENALVKMPLTCSPKEQKTSGGLVVQGGKLKPPVLARAVQEPSRGAQIPGPTKATGGKKLPPPTKGAAGGKTLDNRTTEGTIANRANGAIVKGALAKGAGAKKVLAEGNTKEPAEGMTIGEEKREGESEAIGTPQDPLQGLPALNTPCSQPLQTPLELPATALATQEALDPEHNVPLWQRKSYLQKVQEQRGLLDALPQLHCGVCSIGTDCRGYREGSLTCQFTDMLAAFPVRDADNLLGAMETIVDINKGRLWKLLLIENMVEGGMPSERATALSEVVLNQLERLRDQRSMMEGMAVKVNSGPGILSSIFGITSKGAAPRNTLVQVNVSSTNATNEAISTVENVPARGVVEGVTVPEREGAKREN